MDRHGDIPEFDEVRPDRVDEAHASDEAKMKANLVAEVLETGGVVHLYFQHTQGEGDDRHLYRFNTHVYPDLGMVYWHADDEDHWAYLGDVEMIERHYED